jgi:hypothetical protein
MMIWMMMMMNDDDDDDDGGDDAGVVAGRNEVPDADACCLHVFVSTAGMARAGKYAPQQQPASHLPPSLASPFALTYRSHATDQRQRGPLGSHTGYGSEAIATGAHGVASSSAPSGNSSMHGETPAPERGRDDIDDDID